MRDCKNVVLSKAKAALKGENGAVFKNAIKEKLKSAREAETVAAVAAAKLAAEEARLPPARGFLGRFM